MDFNNNLSREEVLTKNFLKQIINLLFNFYWFSLL